MSSASPDFSVGKKVLLFTSNLLIDISKIFWISVYQEQHNTIVEVGRVHQSQSNFQGMWQLEGVYSSHIAIEQVETEHTQEVETCHS